MRGRAARSSLTARRRPSHPPCRGSNETPRLQRPRRARPGAADAGGRARARPARDAAVPLGHGRLDARHVLHLLRGRPRRVPRSLEGRSRPRARQGREHPALHRGGGLLHARVGARRGGVGGMSLVPTSLPSGESPFKAQQFYDYLQAHQETQYHPDTWHVRWLDLAWLWGFAIALAAVLLWWIWQYRTTRQRIYEVDTFGGYTSEVARPATSFFVLLSLILAGWA